MNNTIKTLPAIAAVLIAATLVVGTAGAFLTTTTKSAFADNNSGNTVTIEECKNKGSASGFDTAVNQECQNLICTHPGSGATCVSEGSQVTPGTGTLLVKKVVVCKDDLIKQPPPPKKCPNPEDFTITVTGNHPDPASFPGSGTGTLVTLGVGPHKVNETPLDVSFSADCTGTIAAGDQKTCTVTNTEQED
jgi:hypothetical protein